MKEVAGILCVGNGAGRLVRGLMPIRGASVLGSSGSKSRSVSSTCESSSPVNTGSSPCKPDFCLYVDLFAKFSLT